MVSWKQTNLCPIDPDRMHRGVKQVASATSVRQWLRRVTTEVSVSPHGVCAVAHEAGVQIRSSRLASALRMARKCPCERAVAIAGLCCPGEAEG